MLQAQMNEDLGHCASFVVCLKLQELTYLHFACSG